jgi:putative heme-binding domain-containing protein
MKKPVLFALSLALGSAVLLGQEPTAKPSPLALLTRALESTSEPSTQLNLLRGINAALKGKRDVAPPEGWPALYEKLKASTNAEVREQAQTLAATFGGGAAIEEFRKSLADAATPIPARKAALDSLLSAKDQASLPAILTLLGEQGVLRGAALRGLASFDDPKIPTAILQSYPGLTSEERRDALGTMVARLPWAKALLAAIDQKTVARSELAAPLARQLQDFKDADVDQWLAKNWGTVRTSSADKQKEIAKYKTFLTPASFETADPQRGRALYSQVCITCHTIFGTGGKVGPELTGAYNDTDYLLQNILDPNAIIGRDYQQTIVKMKDGQMMSGIVTADDQSSVTLKTLAGPLGVQKSDVAEMTVSPVSMMPEGLLSAMSDDEIRDLFAYLRQHGQIPKLATPFNVNDFFTGTDLNGWHGSGEAWKVENGEVVGRSSAKRPEFLVSDLAARNFRFSAEIRLTGADAAAELAVRGYERDGRFEGSSIAFGGAGPVTVWTYRGVAKPESAPGTAAFPPNEWVKCEVLADGKRVEVKVNGQTAATVLDSPGGDRSVLAFHVMGEGAELRIRAPKLELPAN